VCIDLHQTGSAGKGSDHLQLIKFWLSRAPGEGGRGGGNFWLRLTTASAQCLRLLRVLFYLHRFYCLVCVRNFSPEIFTTCENLQIFQGTFCALNNLQTNPEMLAVANISGFICPVQTLSYSVSVYISHLLYLGWKEMDVNYHR